MFLVWTLKWLVLFTIYKGYNKLYYIFGSPLPLGVDTDLIYGSDLPVDVGQQQAGCWFWYLKHWCLKSFWQHEPGSMVVETPWLRNMEFWCCCGLLGTKKVMSYCKWGVLRCSDTQLELYMYITQHEPDNFPFLVKYFCG